MKNNAKEIEKRADEVRGGSTAEALLRHGDDVAENRFAILWSRCEPQAEIKSERQQQTKTTGRD